MLHIQQLRASIEGREILKGIDLKVQAGEVHAIMGPNGSGKSTFAKVLAGHPDYEVTGGKILYEVNFKQKDIVNLSAEERAREGIFLAFQYPVEVPGVSNIEFLRAAFNAVTTHQGGDEMDPLDFNELVNAKMALLGINPNFSNRQLNVDFSGGEKKRNEILQMAVLSPRLAILDETDSGLDIDSLKEVANGIHKLRSSENAVVLITHYQRLLDYIQPDFVHVLHGGRIVQSGDKNIALQLEAQGYERFTNPKGGMENAARVN